MEAQKTALAEFDDEYGLDGGPSPYVKDTTPGPNFVQWYLDDINILTVWPDYRGNGVKIGIFDSAVQTNHPDLDANYNASLNIKVNGVAVNPNPTGTGNNHGTGVAGIIAAEDNGVGIVGMAFEAKITSIPMSGPQAVDWIQAMNYQATFDVVNHSWSYDYNPPFSDNPRHSTSADQRTLWTNFLNAIDNTVHNGRNGLGTVIVTSAGNERRLGSETGSDNGVVWDTNDTNAHAFKNDRHVVTVAAVGGNDFVANYSNPGATVLVAAPSNSFADSSDFIWTTDRTGTAGYNNGSFEPSGNYASFGGTSAAAPIVTGVVALMLQANPSLGWRDVKEILANSATHKGTAVGVAPPSGGPESDTWQFNHATHWNGGGMHFSNDYGFGQIDAHAAVRMAETWISQNTSYNELGVGRNLTTSYALPDGLGGPVIPIELPTGVRIETIEVDLGLVHSEPGELMVRLWNAAGTQSMLLQPVGGAGTTALNGWTFRSNEFLGELSGGTYYLQVLDLVRDEFTPGPFPIAIGVDGSVSGIQLRAYGAPVTNDNLYIYTDEFAKYARDGSGHDFRGFDMNGGVDTINAAAVTTDTVIDLEGGGYTLAGVSGSFGFGGSGDPRDMMIENIIVGDGDDFVAGNIQNNYIYGGYGDDELHGRDGHDRILGGLGINSLYGEAGDDTLSVGYKRNPFAVDIMDGGEGTDTADFSAFTVALAIDLVGPGREVRTRDTSDLFSGTLREFADLVSIENIVGTKGSDEIAGDDKANMLIGNDGQDLLVGRGGIDTLIGGNGRDRLNGGVGADYMYGGQGDDNYLVDDTFDLVDEGAVFPSLGGLATDFDIITSTAGWYWDVYSAAERMIIDPTATAPNGAATTLIGSIFNNAMIGNAGNNVLFGRGGSDTYFGGDGIDYISLSTLGLTNQNAYAGVNGANTIIVEKRSTGPTSYDIVFEFETGKDKFDVSDYGYTNAAQVLARGVNDGAGNTYFALGDGLDYLYVIGLTKGQMAASDFIIS